jgi:hypothetical protein
MTMKQLIRAPLINKPPTKGDAGRKTRPMLFYQATQPVFVSFRNYRQQDYGLDYSDPIL